MENWRWLSVGKRERCEPDSPSGADPMNGLQACKPYEYKSVVVTSVVKFIPQRTCVRFSIQSTLTDEHERIEFDYTSD